MSTTATAEAPAKDKAATDPAKLAGQIKTANDAANGTGDLNDKANGKKGDEKPTPKPDEPPTLKALADKCNAAFAASEMAAHDDKFNPTALAANARKWEFAIAAHAFKERWKLGCEADGKKKEWSKIVTELLNANAKVSTVDNAVKAWEFIVKDGKAAHVKGQIKLPAPLPPVYMVGRLSSIPMGKRRDEIAKTLFGNGYSSADFDAAVSAAKPKPKPNGNPKNKPNTPNRYESKPVVGRAGANAELKKALDSIKADAKTLVKVVVVRVQRK